VFIPPTSDDWLVFHGDANPAEARVYVRLKSPPLPGQSLRGNIQGPTSRYARTLTATNRFTARPHGEEWLAEVVLPDPCFWSPELPYLYQVELTLEGDGQPIWSDQRPFGMRRLGVKGRRLYLEGKNWVLRGAEIEPTATFDWQAYRDQDLALVVNDPSESFCEEADRRGMLIVARIASHELNLRGRLLAWQRHPSIGIAVLPKGMVPPATARSDAPNLLFAASLEEPSHAIPNSSDLVWLEVSGKSDLSHLLTGLSVPAVAVDVAPQISASEARSACDFLQRRLAGSGEFAGYVA
jgi:hypothetical protein